MAELSKMVSLVIPVILTNPGSVSPAFPVAVVKQRERSRNYGQTTKALKILVDKDWPMVFNRLIGPLLYNKTWFYELQSSTLTSLSLFLLTNLLRFNQPSLERTNDAGPS